jgi:hypothetical protein
VAAVAFHHHRAAARWRPGRGRSHRQDRKRDFDRVSFVELKPRLDCLAGFERMLKFHEHEMIAAGLERNRLARLDLEPAFNRPHLHHAIFHAHSMDLAYQGRAQGAERHRRLHRVLMLLARPATLKSARAAFVARLQAGEDVTRGACVDLTCDVARDANQCGPAGRCVVAIYVEVDGIVSVGAKRMRSVIDRVAGDVSLKS